MNHSDEFIRQRLLDTRVLQLKIKMNELKRSPLKSRSIVDLADLCLDGGIKIVDQAKKVIEFRGCRLQLKSIDNCIDRAKLTISNMVKTYGFLVSVGKVDSPEYWGLSMNFKPSVRGSFISDVL